MYPKPSMTERDLVSRFLSLLKNHSNLECTVAKTEFRHKEGSTDIIAVNGAGKLVAFEAKLHNWRKALDQAYRNRSFADSSYVILPPSTAANAMRHIEEFKKRGVGILSVGDIIHSHSDAEIREPLRPWIRSSAVEYLEEH